jgi:MFS family permease
MSAATTNLPDNAPWYSGITRYQWMVLVIASLGWVFDVFEGQIFVASSDEAMPSFIAQQERDSGLPLTAVERNGLKEYYNNIAFGAFLLGGALGGIVFGALSDRIGRKKTMSLTIIFYSLFTCVSAFSVEWWHLAALRFLVAMGVGGEWAVASALVFEEFPKRSRAHVGSIFHASSVLGTYLAIAATTLFIGNEAVGRRITEMATSWGITDPILAASVKWRIGFALGALPALLIIWIRSTLREPAEWEQARQDADDGKSRDVGRLSDLFGSDMLRNTTVGFVLAAVGMATFWGVHVHGRQVMKNAATVELEASSTDMTAEAKTASLKRWEMLGMFLVTTGGGIGLLCFGPISQRIGRRGAFLLYHLGGLASAVVLFGAGTLFGEAYTLSPLYVLLPIFGFLTLGMHAGYAIYFPELFPTYLRSTGTSFCYNVGRFIAATGPLAKGYLYGMFSDVGSTPIESTQYAGVAMCAVFLVGLLVLPFAPETKGKPLPE